MHDTGYSEGVGYRISGHTFPDQDPDQISEMPISGAGYLANRISSTTLLSVNVDESGSYLSKP